MKVRAKSRSLQQAVPILEASRSVIMGGLEALLLSKSYATHVSIEAKHGLLALSTERTEAPPNQQLGDPSWIYHTSNAQVTDEGQALVPAEEFMRFIARVESEDAEILSNATTLKITSGHQQIDLPVTKPTENRYTEMSESLLNRMAFPTGKSFKVNQLLLAKGLIRHAETPPPLDRSSNTFLFFKRGMLRIGNFPIRGEKENPHDYVCLPSQLPENPDNIQFIIPAYTIRPILRELLVHDADVTLRSYEDTHYVVLFENPAALPFFFHWKIF